MARQHLKLKSCSKPNVHGTRVRGKNQRKRDRWLKMSSGERTGLREAAGCHTERERTKQECAPAGPVPLYRSQPEEQPGSGCPRGWLVRQATSSGSTPSFHDHNKSPVKTHSTMPFSVALVTTEIACLLQHLWANSVLYHFRNHIIYPTARHIRGAGNSVD